MSSNVASDSFIFINSSEPKVPKGNAIRLAIRRQAMSRAAAARRQRGYYGKSNLRQLPSIGDLDCNSRAEFGLAHQADTTAERTFTSSVERQPTEPTFNDADSTRSALVLECAVKDDSLQVTIPASLPATGYEAMRSGLDFDILDLSALTTFHVSRITGQQLTAQPTQLIHILRCRQWSFLHYLPSRWGNTPCLEDATRCVVTRVRECLTVPGQSPSKRSLKMYETALHSLQNALRDASQVRTPDVLCATEVLALHELLAYSRPEAWEHHVAGAAALIKLRGPQGYTTPFEKALLLGQVGSIFTEAILKDTPDFLDHPSWQAVLRDSILETTTLSDCSELPITLWMTIAPIPRLLTKVQDLICGPSNNPNIPYQRTLIIDRALHILQSLRTWRARYDALIYTHDDLSLSSLGNGNAEFDKRYETLGVSLSAMCMANRLLVALNPAHGHAYECNAQYLANQIVELEQQAIQGNPRAALFMGFKLAFVKAIIFTAKDFREAIEVAQEGQMIEKGVFERWSGLKGQKPRS